MDMRELYGFVIQRLKIDNTGRGAYLVLSGVWVFGGFKLVLQTNNILTNPF